MAVNDKRTLYVGAPLVLALGAVSALAASLLDRDACTAPFRAVFSTRVCAMSVRATTKLFLSAMAAPPCRAAQLLVAHRWPGGERD
jgi:hypothetical protein